MKKRILIISCIAVFVISAVWVICLQTRPEKDMRLVEIISDGKVLYEIDLEKENDREITVTCNGRKNIITIKDHEIYVSSAECPDHTCMNMGKLSDNGVPIVCLPNKLMIRYKESGGDIDAQT